MDFDKYQYEATLTAKPSAMEFNYLIPGLAAEAGEVAGKYAKFVRDQTKYIDLQDDLTKELGDVLWFVALLCEYTGIDMAQVAKMNIKKLQDRQKRGVISGSGDDR